MQWSTVVSIQLHRHFGTIIDVVLEHVMLRKIAIGQPDTYVISGVAYSKDLKYISGVSDVPIHPDIMGLVIIDTTCEMTRIGSLHDVISVDDNVLQTIKETWIDCSVSIQKNTCVVEVIAGNQ